SLSVKKDIDFLPLTVDYQEKAYAAGKIPGGYFRREGQPSEKEKLSSRLIDRPLRPLFPKGWYSETQVIAMVISADQSGSSDILGIIAASAALAVSNIPFNGPVGAVRVGRRDGQFLINPDLTSLEGCDLNLVVAGTVEAVKGLKKEDDQDRERHVKLVFHELEYTEVRKTILENGKRADGRGPSDIRPITCEVSLLPRTHGSALFTRGETQALAVVTLG